MGAATSVRAAAADAAASSDNNAVTEVVVTARRKAENLQEVPLAISAVTGLELKATSATSLQDVTNLTPGLTYNSGGAEAFTAPVIRGLSDTSGGLASSANVSIFLDGIYIFNPSSIDLSLGRARTGGGCQGSSQRTLWAQRLHRRHQLCDGVGQPDPAWRSGVYLWRQGPGDL